MSILKKNLKKCCKTLKKWKQNEEKFKTTEKIVKSNQTKTLNGKPFDRMNYTSFSQ